MTNKEFCDLDLNDYDWFYSEWIVKLYERMQKFNCIPTSVRHDYLMGLMEQGDESAYKNMDDEHLKEDIMFFWKAID